MTLAQEILEVFEDYLNGKGIIIDNPERKEDENAALLYGTEYGNLEEQINYLIDGTKCHIETCIGDATGKINVKNGELYVKSDSLNSHLNKLVQ